MKDKLKISINDLVFIKAVHEVMSNKEKFNQLKDRYISNFKRTANKGMEVVYENGFVIIKIEGGSGTHKYRISEFERMTLGLESRKDYEAPKPHITKVFEKKILAEEIEVEDGGQALISTVDGNLMEEENGMFVRLQSWDSNKEHTDFNKFVGRKIRITIETID